MKRYLITIALLFILSGCSTLDKVKETTGSDNINVSFCISEDICLDFQFATDKQYHVVAANNLVEKYSFKQQLDSIAEAQIKIEQAHDNTLNQDTTYLLDYEPSELTQLVQQLPASPNPIKTGHRKIENGKPIYYGIFKPHTYPNFNLNIQKKEVLDALGVIFRDFDSELIYTENINKAHFKFFYVEEGDSVPYSNDKFPVAEQSETGGYSVVLGFAYPPYPNLPDRFLGNIVINATRIRGVHEVQKKTIRHEVGHAVGLLHRLLKIGEVAGPELMTPTVGGMSLLPTELEYYAINSLHGVETPTKPNTGDCPSPTPTDTIYVYKKDTVFVNQSNCSKLEELYKRLAFVDSMLEKDKEAKDAIIIAYTKTFANSKILYEEKKKIFEEIEAEKKRKEEQKE